MDGNGNGDRDLWKALFKANYRNNELRFKQIEERLGSVEDLIISHSKKSLSSSHYLYLLMGGLFGCFFLLGFSVEGKIAGSTITYSSNGVTQILLQIFSAGGVAVAIANSPKIKNLFRK